jgi:uncharacterized protein (DUF305 family)
MDHTATQSDHYLKLLVMIGLSFVAMYILMYSMVNAYTNVYNNLNQFYMAGVMAAPMVAIELLVMGAMYKNKRLNAALVVLSVVALSVFFICIRRQTAISDDQFLRSMIPHHAGAILMCEEAKIRKGEIKELCKSIITSQQSEIEQMKSLLEQ